MRDLVGGWSLSLRLARREALRAKARSALVLLMVGLPVMAVVAAAVVLRTQDVSSVEGVDRRIGAAAAEVAAYPGVTRVYQGADPDHGGFDSDVDPEAGSLGEDRVEQLLGGSRRLVPIGGATYRLSTDDGVTPLDAVQVDLRDPLTEGLFRLTSGRWPASADEVVVNQDVLDQGYAVGDRLRSPDDLPTPVVVGVAESSTVRSGPVAAGPAGSLADAVEPSRWLVGGGPVTWDDVLRLNAEGGQAYSRAVQLDPPSPSQVPERARTMAGDADPTVVATTLLVVAMVVLEVALLAGPAFAVGARRQARTLALLVASGGTPRQARRAVLATAVVLGSLAALVGTLAGVVLAAVAMPLVQRMSGTWFGPFEVPVLLVLAITGLGLVSALLAAFGPALLASRQDVVAVLAGRRGDARPSRRSPVAGVVLLALGVLCAVLGATSEGRSSIIALGGILAVLGVVLLVPLVLAGLGRVSGRLPLALRYAVRDAARQRARTAPAVAAVAAVVAGVVALGIGVSSDARQKAETYVPSLADGAGVAQVAVFDDDDVDAEDQSALVRAIGRVVPDARLTEVRGFTSADTAVSITGPDPDVPLLMSYGSSIGTDLLVGDEALRGLPGGTSVAEEVRRSLAAGRSVVFVDDQPRGTTSGEVQVTVDTFDDTTGEATSSTPVALDVTFVRTPGGQGSAQAVLTDADAERLDLPVRTVSVLLTGTSISPAEEESLTEAVEAISANAGVYVERGFVDDEDTVIVLLVLGVLGAVLALGGTLTATFLALSEARPDLATLTAVGASPSTRRRIAASYALVVGSVGSVLGAVVGFVPGLAIAVPLTTVDHGQGTTGPYLDVPWLLVGALVLLLPLLSATLVALATRSRLPLVARAA